MKSLTRSKDTLPFHKSETRYAVQIAEALTINHQSGLPGEPAKLFTKDGENRHRRKNR